MVFSKCFSSTICFVNRCYYIWGIMRKFSISHNNTWLGVIFECLTITILSPFKNFETNLLKFERSCHFCERLTFFYEKRSIIYIPLKRFLLFIPYIVLLFLLYESSGKWVIDTEPYNVESIEFEANSELVKLDGWTAFKTSIKSFTIPSSVKSWHSMNIF